MRILRVINVFCFTLIWITGCTKSGVDTPEATVDDLLQVNLNIVDPEVRQFLSDKQAAARKDPSNALAVGELAMAYEMNGFADTALTGYELASSLAPSTFNWHYFRGLLHASFGEYREGLTSLDAAIVTNRDYGPAWIWHGRWHLELDQFDQALASFKQAVSLGMEGAGTIGLAKVALRRGDANQALKLLQELKGSIAHAQIDHLIRRAETQLGRQLTEQLVERDTMPGEIGFPDPISAEKRSYEVSISAELTRFRRMLSTPDSREAAIELADSLYAKYPHNPRIVAAKVQALRVESDLTNLHALLRAAHANWPNDISFTLGLSELELADRNLTTATTLIEAALRIDPNNPWALMQQGILYAQIRNFEGAIASLNASLAFRESAETHFYLGHAYTVLGDLHNARCQMQRAVALDSTFTDAQVQLERLENEIDTENVAGSTSFTCESVSRE